MSTRFISLVMAVFASIVLNNPLCLNCHGQPVIQNGRLAGLLTAENLGEFLLIQGAMKGAKQA